MHGIFILKFECKAVFAVYNPRGFDGDERSHLYSLWQSSKCVGYC